MMVFMTAFHASCDCMPFQKVSISITQDLIDHIHTIYKIYTKVRSIAFRHSDLLFQKNHSYRMRMIEREMIEMIKLIEMKNIVFSVNLNETQNRQSLC